MTKEKNILQNFGKSVRYFRKQKNISQEKLAEIAGLHRTYIGMIERGEKNITLLNIERLVVALSVEIKDLIDDITLFRP